MPNTTLNMRKDELDLLQQAVGHLPDDLVIDIMEDGVIDAVEMSVLLDKLEQVCGKMQIPLNVHGACQSAISQLITLAADEARVGHIEDPSIDEALCPVTMAEVKGIMASLIASGHIIAGGSHEVDGSGMAANLALEDVRTPEEKAKAAEGVDSV